MLKRQMARVLVLSIALGSFAAAPVFAADDTLAEKGSEVVHDTDRGLSKAARKLRRDNCMKMGGTKASCAKEAVKDKAKDVKGDVEDALD